MYNQTWTAIFYNPATQSRTHEKVNMLDLVQLFLDAQVVVSQTNLTKFQNASAIRSLQFIVDNGYQIDIKHY